MLILSRKVGESVMVGDDVVVTVLEVRGESVRLGVRAPRSVVVHREEVFEQVQRANQAAASTPSDLDAALGAVAAERARRRPRP